MKSSVYLGIDTGKVVRYYLVSRIENGYALKTVDDKTGLVEEHHVRLRKGRWSCDCKAATFRPGKLCKHCEVVRRECETGLLKEIE